MKELLLQFKEAIELVEVYRTIGDGDTFDVGFIQDVCDDGYSITVIAPTGRLDITASRDMSDIAYLAWNTRYIKQLRHRMEADVTPHVLRARFLPASVLRALDHVRRSGMMCGIETHSGARVIGHVAELHEEFCTVDEADELRELRQRYAFRLSEIAQVDAFGRTIEAIEAALGK